MKNIEVLIMVILGCAALALLSYGVFLEVWPAWGEEWQCTRRHRWAWWLECHDGNNNTMRVLYINPHITSCNISACAANVFSILPARVDCHDEARGIPYLIGGCLLPLLILMYGLARWWMQPKAILARIAIEEEPHYQTPFDTTT
jgi:hypothetical protein